MEQNKDARDYIGKGILSLRLSKGYTVSVLAERASIYQPNLSKIENAQTNVGIDILDKIAQALDCHVDFVDNETQEVPRVLRELYAEYYCKEMHLKENASIETELANITIHKDGKYVNIEHLIHALAAMYGYKDVLEKI